MKNQTISWCGYFLLFLGCGVLGCATRTEQSGTAETVVEKVEETFAALPGDLIEAKDAVITVSLESNRESLYSGDGEIVTDLSGKSSSVVMVEARAGQAVEEIQVRLDDDTGRPVSPTWALDSIASAEPVLFRRIDWTFDGIRGSHDLTMNIAYKIDGRAVRYARPCQLVFPGIQSTALQISAEENQIKSNKIVPAEHRNALGYDFAMAPDDRLLTTLEFRGPEAMMLRTSTFKISAPSHPGLKLDVVEQNEDKDKVLALEVILSSNNLPVGRHAIRLIAEYIADDFSSLRTWELRVGVYDVKIARQDDRSTLLKARLPGGSTATLELPTHRIDPRCPTDLAITQARLSDMAEKHLPVLLEGSTLGYRSEDPIAKGEAWRDELSLVFGSSFAYQACLAWARHDVAASGDTPSAAFDLAYLRAAQDTGVSAGPGLFSQSIGDWRPSVESNSTTLVRPTFDGKIPFEKQSFQRTARTLDARLTQVIPKDGKSVEAEALESSPLPVSPIDLEFTMERKIGDGIRGADLLLLEPNARSLEIKQPVKGTSTRFHVSNLSSGKYRGSLVLRNSRNEIVGVGRSFHFEVSGKAKKREVPDELLSLLSPTERKRLNSGKPYSKTVVRTDPSGTQMVVKRVVLQRSEVLNKGMVKLELASARYDAKRGVTVLQLRVSSKQKKTWNLTLKAASRTATDVLSEEPSQQLLRKVRMELDKDQPELVTIDVPGEIGDTLSVVQATVDGSPTNMVSTSGVGAAENRLQSPSPKNTRKLLKKLPTTQSIRRDWDNRSTMSLGNFKDAFGPMKARNTRRDFRLRADVGNAKGLKSGAKIKIPVGAAVKSPGGAQGGVNSGSFSVGTTGVRSSLEDNGADDMKCVCTEADKPMPKVGEIYELDGEVDPEKQRFLAALRKLRVKPPRGISEDDMSQLVSWGHDKLQAGVSASPMTKGKLKQAVRSYMEENPRMVKNIKPKEREVASGIVADVMMKAAIMSRR